MTIDLDITLLMFIEQVRLSGVLDIYVSYGNMYFTYAKGHSENLDGFSNF